MTSEEIERLDTEQFITLLKGRIVREANNSFKDIFQKIQYIENHPLSGMLLSNDQKQSIRLDALRTLITTMEE